MAELVFILTDFPLAASSAGGNATADAAYAPQRQAMPRLPALETLLARAHSELLPDDWRTWLSARVGAAACTPAATVAAASDAAAGGADAPAGHPNDLAHYWLATPVHLSAGLDSVRLHPAGLLQLRADEQQVLVEQFARVFADSPWRLRTLGQRELLLAGPPLHASGSDPARFAGDNPLAGLPRGPDAASLKRLGSEIELWLHEHALNLERTRRDELPITTLWFWGAELAPIPSAAAAAAAAEAAGTRVAARRPLARLYGRDTYAEALWRLQGAVAEALPPDFNAAVSLLEGPTDSVLLIPMCEQCGLGAAVVQLEQRWIAAASEALRRRRIDALQLIAGTHSHRLSWLSLGRLWRARVPWWEGLA